MPISDPHAHIVYKPVVPRKSAASTAPRQSAEDSRAAAGTHMADDPYVRAENEDDDGYDPYSDRPAEREPLFERDPWR